MPDAPTVAYTAFSTGHPVITDTRAVAIGYTLSNLLALRDAIVTGGWSGWNLTTSGGTAEEPLYKIWDNGGNRRQRAKFTYSAGYVTQVEYDWSTDAGVTWEPQWTSTFSYDGSKNSTTATNPTVWSWLYEWIGKFKALRTTALAHFAETTGAHGAGTMYSQNANAVAITGGSVSCTTEREAVTALGNVSASTQINWAAGGMFTATITGASGTFTHTNLPSGVVGYATLLVTNPGVATTLLSGVKWANGTVPTFTASGKDLVTLMCADGGTVYGSFLKDLR